jgi:ribosomal protein S27AE
MAKVKKETGVAAIQTVEDKPEGPSTIPTPQATQEKIDAVVATTVVKSKKGQAPMKPCPKCGFSQHVKKAKCEKCGHEFPAPAAKAAKASNAFIVKSAQLPEDWLAEKLKTVAKQEGGFKAVLAAVNALRDSKKIVDSLGGLDEAITFIEQVAAIRKATKGINDKDFEEPA